MPQERIGEVTDIERDEILKLHERRTALKELFLTLNSPYLTEEEQTKLREGLIDDLARTNSLYERWWRDIQTRYSLKSREHGELMIDFQSRELSFRPVETRAGGVCSCDDLPFLNDSHAAVAANKQ